MHDDRTIFAPASAVGVAGVAVFRVSGQDARNAIEQLCVPNDLPLPRFASIRKIINPQSREVIDHALILFFPAPHSFTGEDVVEFHTHGGRAVTSSVSLCLASIDKYRLAEPGEFTRRAFENGKLDLTEAEAVVDLIHAETEAQRKQALRQLDGELGKIYEEWRGRLSQSLAYLEAAIDFADEELPADLLERQLGLIDTLSNEIGRHLNDGNRGEKVRQGFLIAIVGPPNVGKSSLLNALARRDVAIISPTAGTTRDVLEVQLDIAGFPVVLADTAGLRDAGDAIESEGMRRAVKVARQADLRIVMFDGSYPSPVEKDVLDLIDDQAVIVFNKADLLSVQTTDAAANSWRVACPELAARNLDPFIFISVAQSRGVEELLGRLGGEIEKRFGAVSAMPLTRLRHREALEDCLQSLRRARTADSSDLRAEDVRLAMRALGRITGRVDVEDLLDIIFRDFCIGK